MLSIGMTQACFFLSLFPFFSSLAEIWFDQNPVLTCLGSLFSVKPPPAGLTWRVSPEVFILGPLLSVWLSIVCVRRLELRLVVLLVFMMFFSFFISFFFLVHKKAVESADLRPDHFGDGKPLSVACLMLNACPQLKPPTTATTTSVPQVVHLR